MLKIELENRPRSEKWLNTFVNEENILRSERSRKDLYKMKFTILTLNPAFIERVDEIKREYLIPRNGFKDNKLILSWAKNKIDSKYRFSKYNKKILKLLRDFNIAERWRPCVEYFIFLNDKKIDHIMPNAVEILPIGNKKERIELRIAIFKDTTEKDIKEAWPWISMAQNLLNPSNKIIELDGLKNYTLFLNKEEGRIEKIPHWIRKAVKKKDLDVYIKILNLKKNGKTPKEISKLVFNNETSSPKISSYLSKLQRIFDENELY